MLTPANNFRYDKSTSQSLMISNNANNLSNNFNFLQTNIVLIARSYCSVFKSNNRKILGIRISNSNQIILSHSTCFNAILPSFVQLSKVKLNSELQICTSLSLTENNFDIYKNCYNKKLRQLYLNLHTFQSVTL